MRVLLRAFPRGGRNGFHLVSFIVLQFAVFGCDRIISDRVSTGYYRAETVGVAGCTFAVSAERRDDQLVVSGRLRGFSGTSPLSGEVTVTLLDPQGVAIALADSPLTNVTGEGKVLDQVRFETVFKQDPPRGTVIRILPRVSLCVPVRAASTSPKE